MTNGTLEAMKNPSATRPEQDVGSPFARVELALKLEALIKKSSRQGQRTDLCQNSDKGSKALDTKKELARLAGVSHDTIGKGEEAIQYARSYAFEAERKMGEMLAQTERAKGAKGNPKGRGAKIVQSHHVTAQPTLASLGLTKRESAEAQKQPELPGTAPTSSVEIIHARYSEVQGVLARLKDEQRRILVMEVDHRRGRYVLHVQRHGSVRPKEQDAPQANVARSEALPVSLTTAERCGNPPGGDSPGGSASGRHVCASGPQIQLSSFPHETKKNE